MRQILAAAALAALAGCSSAASSSTTPSPSQPHATVTVTPSPAQPAVIADTSTPPGSKFCGRLESAPDATAYYASEVAYQAQQAGGNVKAGKTVVALWIEISCPQFAYLEQGG